jgi:hypothetical protein
MLPAVLPYSVAQRARMYFSAQDMFKLRANSETVARTRLQT